MQRSTVVINRSHEQTLIYRSDSFLYLAVLSTDCPVGRWDGEMGWASKPLLTELFRDLRKNVYDGEKCFQPFTSHARVENYALLTRYGKDEMRLGANFQPRLCTDADTVSIKFTSFKELSDFVNELESCLSWAA